MKRILLLLCVASVFSDLGAQLKTYVSLEAGPQWSLIKANDPGGYFRNARVNSSIAGMTVEQEVLENLFVVTGLYYLPYKTGINMDDRRRQQSRVSSHNCVMIPLRVQYRIQPTEYPVSFSPRLGYAFSINSDKAMATSSSVLSAPDGTAFSYDMAEEPEVPSGHLLELGIGIGLRFSGLWQASFNLSYLSGVLSGSSSSFTLDYTDQQGTTYNAEYLTRGNGIYSSLSFQMPVSNLWQNRDYRIRSRIENSVYKGKAVERKGQLYAGGELGSLWRLFATSNPAVGARPMQGRGIFRYANFHTGAYAGYMLTDELGVDLGVNYQRSNSFYAIMYDHEVDFTAKQGAPMYLEVPLRIRYFYEVIEDQIYAVVLGGASLLTHFSSGTYASPGGDFEYTDPATQAPGPAASASVGQRLSRFRAMIRLGAGAEYRLPMDFPMFATAYVNYMQGFQAAEEISVTTSVPELPGPSLVVYNGSGWTFDVGVKIPMSFDDRENCVRLTREKKIKGN